MDAERLICIMRELAQETPSFNSEREFHCRLFHRLAEEVSEAAFEPAYERDLLLNNAIIRPDIVTCEGTSGLAVELKFVTADGRNGEPADRPAFPYDVIKDCAKIECLLHLEANDLHPILNGIVVGMTDFPAYWRVDPADTNWQWSTNFQLPDRGRGWQLVPRRLFEVVRTPRREQIAGAVFENGRYHVALKRWWQYQWIDYSRIGDRMLRHIILRPERNDRWIDLVSRAAPDPLTTIPFPSAQRKAEASQFRDQCRAEHHRLRR